MQKIAIVVDVQRTIFKTSKDKKNIYSGSDPILNLILTLRLTLGLGLGLTPGKTMSVEKLKPNEKD